MKKIGYILIISACLAALISLTGCSKARQYAQEARSSYISARAVLVGVQEFPSQMEELLRSENLEGIGQQADALISDTRDLLAVSSSSFEDCREKCQQLKNEGSKKFDPYADMMLELVNLNEQLISSYANFISLSQRLLPYDPYLSNPDLLMPALNELDTVAFNIEEQRDHIRQLEGEAEQLYLSITK